MIVYNRYTTIVNLRNIKFQKERSSLKNVGNGLLTFSDKPAAVISTESSPLYNEIKMERSETNMKQKRNIIFETFILRTVDLIHFIIFFRVKNASIPMAIKSASVISVRLFSSASFFINISTHFFVSLSFNSALSKNSVQYFNPEITKCHFRIVYHFSQNR